MAKPLSGGGFEIIGSKDSAFTFPLPTQVEGTGSRGKPFAEDTVLSSISHQGSSFYLKTPVEVGARLKLMIDLPDRLAEDKALKLVIKGRVVKIDRREGALEQKITIKFDSKYIIKPEA